MKGWFEETYRHSLAAKGIRTSMAGKEQEMVFRALAQEVPDVQMYEIYQKPLTLEDLDKQLSEVQEKLGYRRPEPVSDEELAQMMATFEKSQYTGNLPLSLAAKSRAQLVKEHKSIVKPFFGENPRMTKQFARFRQQDPKKYDDFRTKKIGDNEFIYGHNKKTDKWELQSILIKR
jgi:hypothetical protein